MPFTAKSQARGANPTGIEPALPASVLLHVPPSARERRAQAVHRLQVGLFGLAGMLLIVSLANVIMDRAKYLDSTAVNTAEPTVSASETTAKDPLVDMGVAPGLPMASQNKPTVAISPAPPPTPAPTINAPRP
ncbi:MAG: hypothetical protein RIS85_187 [Pseudomonadota bacterium]|jgi:hypothetical protein